IRPLQAGPIRIAWALVVSADCGELVVSQGSSSGVTSIGEPRLVIQNLYSLETPERVNVTVDGKYRLHVFPDRFRVFDDVTGALVVEAPGRDVSFSPTGRFVSAYGGGEQRSNFRIFDLDAGEMILDAMGDALIWQNADSALVVGADRYQRMAVLQSIVDDASD